MKGAKSLPVLMYHYINNWTGSITVIPELFEEHCAHLARHGYRGISIEEAESYLLHGCEIPEKSVLFTFDDGFLDNYVYAWPILQKYGHKGVIFAVANKVVNGQIRPNSCDLAEGRVEHGEFPRVDQPFMTHGLGYKKRRDLFINWEEAKLMEESGTMRVIPHSLNHRSVFAGPEFDGIYCPGQRTRTFDRVDSEVPWGLPFFKPVPGLANRAFIVDGEFIEAVKNLVPQDEEEAFSFFGRADACGRVHSLYREWQGRMGYMETDAEREERTRKDFLQSKELVETGLGHSVRSFCWPWGAYDDLSLRVGRECGFEVFFTTRIGANPPGKPFEVKRFKAKSKSPGWLLNRCRVYSSPFLSKCYTMLRQEAK